MRLSTPLRLRRLILPIVLAITPTLYADLWKDPASGITFDQYGTIHEFDQNLTEINIPATVEFHYENGDVKTIPVTGIYESFKRDYYITLHKKLGPNVASVNADPSLAWITKRGNGLYSVGQNGNLKWLLLFPTSGVNEFVLDPECTSLRNMPNIRRIVIPNYVIDDNFIETGLRSYNVWEGLDKLEELIFLGNYHDDGHEPFFHSTSFRNNCPNLRSIRFPDGTNVSTTSGMPPNIAQCLYREVTLIKSNYGSYYYNVSFLPIEKISINADYNVSIRNLSAGVYYTSHYESKDGLCLPKDIHIVIRGKDNGNTFWNNSYGSAGCWNTTDNNPYFTVEIEEPVDADIMMNKIKNNTNGVTNLTNCYFTKLDIQGEIISPVFRNCPGIDNLSIQNIPEMLGNLFLTTNDANFKDLNLYQTITQYKEDGTTQASSVPKRLASLTLTDGCEEIPYGALSNCTMLERLTIASSVFKVGEKALYGCARLKDIYLKGAEPPVAFDNSFEGMRMSSCHLHVPAGCVEAYRNAPGWRLFSLIEDDGADAVISVSKTVENGGVIYGLNSYDYGDVCELTAVANSGYTFAGWYDYLGNLITNGATLRQEVTASATYVADFRADIGTGNSEATPGDGSAIISWPVVSGAPGYDIKIYASNDSENAIQTIHIDAAGNQSRADENSDLFKVTIDNLTTDSYVYRINVLNADGITTDQICGAFTIEKSELFEVESDAVSVEIVRGEGVRICGTTEATHIRILSIGGSIMYDDTRSGIYTIRLPRGIYIVQLPDKTLKVQI